MADCLMRTSVARERQMKRTVINVLLSLSDVVENKNERNEGRRALMGGKTRSHRVIGR